MIEIGSVIGSYHILEEVGVGGMGKVYRGLDTMLRREVAIKVLRPEMTQSPALVERFRNEAVVLARLSHPSIALLYNLLHHDPLLFMVMEFVHGETLDKYLREKGPPPYADTLKMFIRILDAIGYAHEHGIIHRDIKPSNIMITPTGGVKVMDFGIARVLGTERMTREGSLVGTVEYMAPEQIRGQDSNERTDIYSLGLLLYEMLSGRPPFTNTNPYDLMRAHIELPPPRPRIFVPQLSPAIEQAILCALSKLPEERFANTREFRAALLNGLRSAGAESGELYHRLVEETSLEDELARLTAGIQQEADAAAAETKRRLIEEARRQNAQEAIRLAEAERRKLVEEARKQAEVEAARYAATERQRLIETARRQAEQEAARQAEAERQRLLEEARRQAEAEAEQRAAAERQRRVEEARRQAEAEAAQRAAAERARLVEEARKQAEQQAAHLAAAERQRLIEEARKQAEAEAARHAIAEEKRLLEEARKRAEAEASRQAEAERQELLAAAQKRAEQEATQRALQERQRLIEEARHRAEQEAAKRAAVERTRLLDEARKQAEAEAAKIASEEEARLMEAARKQAEEEAAQLAVTERTRLLQEARRRAEQEATQRALQERQRLVEEARRQAEAEAARLGEEEEQRLVEEARKQAEQEAARLGEEERQRLVEEARKRAEAGATRRAAKERKRLIAEEKKRAKHEAQRHSAELQKDPYGTALLADGALVEALDGTSRRWLLFAGLAVLLAVGAFFIYRAVTKPPPPQPQLTLLPIKFVQIPGGVFRQGRNYKPQATEELEWASLQIPAHEVTVAPFEIGQTEVTNEQYAQFVQAKAYSAPSDWGGTKPPAGQELWPVRYVSYEDALAFAAWRAQQENAQYRLPTEAEWELAAKGPTQNRYPWGNAWEEGRANLGTNVPKPVGSYPTGASPYGVLDMLGNVSEWTASRPLIYPGNPDITQVELEQAYPGHLAVRGGSYADAPNDAKNPLSVTARGFLPPATKQPNLGFRLVREVR